MKKIEYSNNDLIEKISEEIKRRSKPLQIIAEESMADQVEEIKNYIQNYIMQGYTLTEIEVLLEDFGYDTKVMNQAIKEIKEKNIEMQEKGPFSVVVKGQKIKLNNGMVGIVDKIFSDRLKISLNKEDTFFVEENVIVNASMNKLATAQKLRLEASKLFLQAQELEQIQPQEITQQKPEEEFELKTTPTFKKSPKMDVEVPKKIIDVEEASEFLGEYVSIMEGLRQEKNSVEEELNAARELVKEQNAKIKELTGKESELAKQLGSIIGTELDAMDKLEETVFKKFNNKLIAYKRYIEATEKPPKFTDKHEKLIELIKSKVPDIADEIFKSLDEWEQSASTITEKLKTDIALIEPTKKMMSKKISQNVLEKFKSWLSKTWTDVKNKVSDLYNKIFPEVDKLSNEIDNILVEESSQEQVASIEKVFEEFKL